MHLDINLKNNILYIIMYCVAYENSYYFINIGKDMTVNDLINEIKKKIKFINSEDIKLYLQNGTLLDNNSYLYNYLYEIIYIQLFKKKL
jgi:hypothetical protein